MLQRPLSRPAPRRPPRLPRLHLQQKRDPELQGVFAPDFGRRIA